MLRFPQGSEPVCLEYATKIKFRNFRFAETFHLTFDRMRKPSRRMTTRAKEYGHSDWNPMMTEIAEAPQLSRIQRLGKRLFQGGVALPLCLTLLLISSSVQGQENGTEDAQAEHQSNLTSLDAAAQQKRSLEHKDYDLWKSVIGGTLSRDGQYLMYFVNQYEKDGMMYIKQIDSGKEYQVERGSSARFSYDSQMAMYLVRPKRADVEAAREKKQPAPATAFEMLNLTSGATYNVDRVRSFRVPEKASGWIAILLDKPALADAAKKTNAGTQPPKPSGESKEASKNEKKKTPGTVLIVRNLETGLELRYPNVTSYSFTEDGKHLAWTASSDVPTEDGVFVLALPNLIPKQIISGAGTYQSITFDEAGRNLIFHTNRDDYEAETPKRAIYHWRVGQAEAKLLANHETEGIPEGWEIAGGSLSFSQNSRRVFLTTQPTKPKEEKAKDSDEDPVKVDIWNWQDPLLQPMQLRQAQSEANRSYQAMIDLGSKSFIQLATKELKGVSIGNEGNSSHALGFDNQPYEKLISWESPRFYDIYLIDLSDGSREQILKGARALPSFSPLARYIYWWDAEELAWMTRPVGSNDANNVSESIPFPVENELHDTPSLPRSYGVAGWSEGDRGILIYDSYDIWLADPNGRKPAKCVTEQYGREHGIRLRYTRTDREERFIKPDQTMMLRSFHIKKKSTGFYTDQLNGEDKPAKLVSADEQMRLVAKAEDSSRVLLTRETFRHYPDLWTTDTDFHDFKRHTNVNSHQDDFLWGTAELHEWTSLDGIPLQGILYKPEDFDPNKKYPMMVYFYERSSDQLHRYVTPSPSRASINFSFYVSRGYLVFVPDIPYRDGHPGQSSVNAILPGVTSLISEGFVKEDAIGTQGHSWGGYQTAFLVTRSNLFAAAESGAPVSNMTSAYGGIRWSSGMSRMFQYERTQSRIGGTLWDAQQKYIENSPLFSLDQCNTPLLILHNDEDGAVPWYQGIELFVGLRRLDKPAWLFNYNGEDHGLRQRQNMLDWSIRMQQFFDHFLMDAPAPVWLEKGVPAVDKGKTLGLELIEDEKE